MEIARFRLTLTTAVVRHIGERKAPAATEHANSTGWCEASHGALREGQTAPNMRQIRGYGRQQLRTIPEFPLFKPLRDCAVLRHGVTSDRRFRVGIVRPPIPGRAKRSSLRQ